MISKSLEQTKKIATDFALNIRPATKAKVIALNGDLGSGKTTFTKYFAEALGISPETVTSPTFVIQKSFDISHSYFKKFVHIDAYRLEKPEEIEKLGWRETISDPTNLILVEWPENIGAALPPDSVTISFAFIDENTREIVFN
jgi:tRNA threonylcarbamoyladenosine biosynthesis protein TsaE